MNHPTPIIRILSRLFWRGNLFLASFRSPCAIRTKVPFCGDGPFNRFSVPWLDVFFSLHGPLLSCPSFDWHADWLLAALLPFSRPTVCLPRFVTLFRLWLVDRLFLCFIWNRFPPTSFLFGLLILGCFRTLFQCLLGDLSDFSPCEHYPHRCRLYDADDDHHLPHPAFFCWYPSGFGAMRRNCSLPPPSFSNYLIVLFSLSCRLSWQPEARVSSLFQMDSFVFQITRWCQAGLSLFGRQGQILCTGGTLERMSVAH